MTWQDSTNGLFEITGSIAVWLNVQAIYRDKGYAGGRVYVTVFFLSWSIWNGYYYPHLNQWMSTIGTVSIGLANLAYLSMMLHYGRKK